jgi:hypothetical protein
MPSAMRASSLIIALAALAISESAIAAEATCKVYEGDQLARSGVTPIAIRPLQVDASSIPPWFFCDRIACWGTIGTKFLIDRDGVPRNVRVTSNSFPQHLNRNAEREAFVRNFVANIRYKPMRVKGKPACVLHHLHLKFEMGS